MHSWDGGGSYNWRFKWCLQVAITTVVGVMMSERSENKVLGKSERVEEEWGSFQAVRAPIFQN